MNLFSENHFFFFFNWTFRTEILECHGDLDFLAKLHCVRQACEVRSDLTFKLHVPAVEVMEMTWKKLQM